mmetsp:Transcript_13390/g.44100  ORF Transcript_13390/g.44100 Transcript_13390/m.44100 type:complete len:519 (-) Transcript_13390:24-1580(-)
MGVSGSSVATSIFALVSFGISQMKLHTSPGVTHSGTSCHGEIALPAASLNLMRNSIEGNSPSPALVYAARTTVLCWNDRTGALKETTCGAYERRAPAKRASVRMAGIRRADIGPIIVQTSWILDCECFARRARAGTGFVRGEGEDARGVLERGPALPSVRHVEQAPPNDIGLDLVGVAEESGVVHVQERRVHLVQADHKDEVVPAIHVCNHWTSRLQHRSHLLPREVVGGVHAVRGPLHVRRINLWHRCLVQVIVFDVAPLVAPQPRIERPRVGAAAVDANPVPRERHRRRRHQATHLRHRLCHHYVLAPLIVGLLEERVRVGDDPGVFRDCAVHDDVAHLIVAVVRRVRRGVVHGEGVGGGVPRRQKHKVCVVADVGEVDQVLVAARVEPSLDGIQRRRSRRAAAALAAPLPDEPHEAVSQHIRRVQHKIEAHRSNAAVPVIVSQPRVQVSRVDRSAFENVPAPRKRHGERGHCTAALTDCPRRLTDHPHHVRAPPRVALRIQRRRRYLSCCCEAAC